MEGLLKAAWFTKRNFSTKMDGMKFIKNHKKLSKKFQEMSDEIEEYKYEQVNVFDEYFGKFENEKEIAVIASKDDKKSRAIKKKEIQKEELKNEMKAEIIKEILMEKNEDVVPKYDKSVDYNKLDNLFLQVVGKNLSKKQLDEIKKIKYEAELAFMTLVKIADKLNEM
jgi:hypothetical protein